MSDHLLLALTARPEPGVSSTSSQTEEIRASESPASPLRPGLLAPTPLASPPPRIVAAAAETTSYHAPPPSSPPPATTAPPPPFPALPDSGSPPPTTSPPASALRGLASMIGRMLSPSKNEDGSSFHPGNGQFSVSSVNQPPFPAPRSVNPWSASFTVLVKRLASELSTSQHRGDLMERIGRCVINYTSFEPPVGVQAKRDLLALWEICLGIAEDPLTHAAQQEIAFLIIVAVISRDEFTLASLKPTEDPDGHHVRQHQEEWWIEPYLTLLRRTHARACRGLKGNTKSPAEAQFAASCLVLFFFRLPASVGSAAIVDAVQARPSERRAGSKENFRFRPKPTHVVSKRGTRQPPRLLPAEDESGGEDSEANDVGEDGKKRPEAPPEPSSPSSPATHKSPWTPAEEKFFIETCPDLFLWLTHDNPPAVVAPPPRDASPAASSTKPDAVTTSATTKSPWRPSRAVVATPTSMLPVLSPTTSMTDETDQAAWFRWLTSKDGFFLAFFEAFVQYVRTVTNTSTHFFLQASAGRAPSTLPPRPSDHYVCWSVVPLFEVCLNGFIPLLRSAVWWDSVARRTPGQGQGWVSSLQAYMRVKRTTCAVLEANKWLLPDFCATAMECTNLHSLLSVDSGVEHLNLFLNIASVPCPVASNLNAVAPRGLSTPSSRPGSMVAPSFCYPEFWESIKAMLDSESFQTILKVVSFLYNNMHLFYGANRSRLVNDLLATQFFRLFLHWSPEVRACFHHLVVYKMLRADRRYLPCFSDSQVMVLYGAFNESGTKPKRPSPATPPKAADPARVQAATRAAWGKQPLPASPTSPSGDLPVSNLPASPNQPAEVLPVSRFSNAEEALRHHAAVTEAAQAKLAPPATPEEIARLTRSAQRRLALFDRANTVDDEELLSDMAFSSKIDSYVRMCLAFKDQDGGGVPAAGRPYVEPALEQYAALLLRYYRGCVATATLDDIPDTLSHRMVLSSFGSEQE